jgi:hypothetical protein
MSSILDKTLNFINTNEDLIKNPGREAATRAWQLWFKSVTGEEAILVRQNDKNIITWKPGQAEKMSKYFEELLYPIKKKPDAPETRGYGFSEVDVDWKAVYMPIVYKRVIPIVIIYTALAFTGGYMFKKWRK